MQSTNVHTRLGYSSCEECSVLCQTQVVLLCKKDKTKDELFVYLSHDNTDNISS